MNYIINSLSLVFFIKKHAKSDTQQTNLEAWILKRSQWIQNHDKMHYLFISQGSHRLMIINIVVKDLLWNGKAKIPWTKLGGGH